MNSESMTIGQVAAQAQVHVETIRYYQRLGLVAEPPRPLGGVRHYDGKTVARLRFIKRAQQLGFSLDEVRNLLALEDGQSCRQTRALAERKLDVIEGRLADLRRMQKMLKGLIVECNSGKRPRSCPIIATLSALD
jgi:MerR family mercuric resistance operon transcriptional regulator